MSDLAAALEALEGDPGPNASPSALRLEIVLAAARERLAQLPETCGTCGGDGSPIVGYPCKDCHGRGIVYPAETVEKIKRAINGIGLNLDQKAVAVLDALNTETL